MTSSPKEIRRLRAALEAAEWTQKLESGPLKFKEREDFVEWLRESPVHVAEILRAKQINNSLRGFSLWTQLMETTPRGADGNAREAIEPLPTRASRITGSNVPRYVIVAASIVVATLTIALLMPYWGWKTYSTQVGERREIRLADGSVVTLAFNTAIRVHLTSTQRSITLEHGEALFHVAKEPSRPFIVDAAKTSIRAVGTIFNVNDNGGTVVVTVTEGRVAIEAAPGKSDRADRSKASITVVANQQIAVSAAGQAMPIHALSGITDQPSLVSQVSFESETVEAIVERFNRVNKVKIRILDDDLAKRRVSGVFRESEPQSFAAFLEAAAQAHMLMPNENEIDIAVR